MPRNNPARRAVLIPALALTLALGACETVDTPWLGGSSGDKQTSIPATTRNAGLWDVEVLATQTVEGVGAAQGITMHNGLVYIYGDGATGVIREYDLIDYPTTELRPTGRYARLTKDGEDWISHPTGLAIHHELGTWMGDTVNHEGVLYKLDWDRLWEDGTLDDAILHTAIDDVATNGTRPEWVRSGRGWALATADYGAEGNALRLYDPRRLEKAARTSRRGVVIATLPAGEYVQTLEWLDPTDELVLVQNTEEGRGSRLTTSTINGKAIEAAVPVDLPEVPGELEGFVWVAGDTADSGVGILVNSSATDNVTFVRLVRRTRLGKGS